MKACCPANQFDHGCENGKCRSATRPIINLTTRADRTAQARRAQSSIIITFQYAIAGALCLVLVSGAFIQFAVPGSKRLALVNQEQVSWGK